MLDLIAKKRDGSEHAEAELDFIAQGAARGTIPDYQLSAWLMAVLQRGMTRAETVSLTRAMAASGRPLRLGRIKRKKADKHSTGGVGDGISLVLAPMAAAAGLAVPMMSGRGLGHTGGTLDKLESIPGLKVRFPPARVERQVASIGISMFGQSEELAPADRCLYALRDATGTVPAEPLIVASILSKKLCEDLDALVLDVKCGSGAIFDDPRKASSLAKALIDTAKGAGLACEAVLTRMDEPLGLAIGNALEIRQAIAFLQGEAVADDFSLLTYTLGARMLVLTGCARSHQEASEKLYRTIADGSALKLFKAMVKAQGGDPRVADNPDSVLPKARLMESVTASRTGFVSRLDALSFGRAAVALGAGRDRKEDPLDYGAGILLAKKIGDPVKKGETIARLYAADTRRITQARMVLKDAVLVEPKVSRRGRLIRMLWS